MAWNGSEMATTTTACLYQAIIQSFCPALLLPWLATYSHFLDSLTVKPIYLSVYGAKRERRDRIDRISQYLSFMAVLIQLILRLDRLKGIHSHWLTLFGKGVRFRDSASSGWRERKIYFLLYVEGEFVRMLCKHDSRTLCDSSWLLGCILSVFCLESYLFFLIYLYL